MKQLIVVALVLVLAGCTPGTWTKPGATSSDFDQAKQACMYDIQLHNQDGNPFMAYELLKECMQGKGYTQGHS